MWLNKLFSSLLLCKHFSENNKYVSFHQYFNTKHIDNELFRQM